MNTPTIHLTDTARRAIREAAGDGEPAQLRVEIGDRYEYGLRFDEPAASDLVLPFEGVSLLLDPASAARADGLTVDFVEDQGFTIENPKAAPPRVHSLSAGELKTMIDRGEDFVLMDVRTEAERAIARIEGSRLLDQDGHAWLMGLDRSTTVVFQCHHGVRSLAAAEYCLREGFRNLYNLTGGIDAWSMEVDPKVPRY